MLQSLTVKGFIDELASKSPAPGGGSVAALSASLASALSSMVFNLTIGKKDYLEFDDATKAKVDKAFEDSSLCQETFLELMERDTSAFLKLMDAFKMPKNTEEEINARKEKIKEGNRLSLEIPLEVAEKAFKIYDYVEIALNYGNVNATSDAGVAASLVETAIEGALLNVKINALGLKDEAQKKELRDKCADLLKRSKERKEKLMNIVESKLV